MQTPLPMPATIRAFLEDILNSAGIRDVNKDIRESMIEELYQRLDKYLILKVIDYLPAEKLEEFTEFTEKHPSPAELQKYMEANVPNVNDVFIVAFTEFRDTYLKGSLQGKGHA